MLHGISGKYGENGRRMCTTYPTANGNSHQRPPGNDQDCFRSGCSQACGKRRKNLIVKPVLRLKGVYNPHFAMEKKSVHCSYDVFHKSTALMMRVDFEI